MSVGYTKCMKISLERVLVGILLLIAAVIVVHAPLTVWLGTIWPRYSQEIKSWKELLMALALALFIIEAVRRNKATELLNDRLMQLALVFAGIHFLMIGILDGSLHAAGAGLLIDLRYIFYFVLVYGTLRLYPQHAMAFLKVFAGGATVVVIFALLQLFVLPKDILAHIGYSKQTIAPYLTVDQNQRYVRINSTLRGPNPLGAYAMGVAAIVAAYIACGWRSMKLSLRWIVVLTIITATWITITSYSRSSVIGLVVAIVAIAAIATTGRVRQWLGIATVATVLVIAGLLFALRGNSVVSNVLLHDNPNGGTGTAADSNAGHEQSLLNGVKQFVVQPLGAGVGSTGSASLGTKKPLIIENQYLFVAHEAGWAGLAVFLWLFVDVLRRLWLRRSDALALGVFAAGLGLAAVGVLLPVWTDDTVSIIWWGLAAVAITIEGKGKKHAARTSH